MKRPYLRALLASAAVAGAIALAGCNADDLPTNGRANAPLSEKMISEIASKNMDKDSPMLARIFKEEAELEVWKKNRDGEYALLKTYPICRWSGDLGPKKKEGDRQAPEGFYTITPGQMNPASNYYLAFNTGFPNTYDRAWGYSGSELMVHGDCSSRGCYAMTDEQIQEIYALARESFFGGQKAFQLEAFPFRMTAMNMAKHRNNPNFAFWKMLKEGYDHFEATKQEPKVAVCEKRYVFDPAEPDNSTKPLKFDARGKCPVFQLDKNIADVVLDKRRQEQFQMAEYIAKGVPTVPLRAGIDGGMNPVFADKISTQDGYDSKGHLIQVATAPGSLPRGDKPIPQTVVSVPKPVTDTESAPVVMASVPVPQPAPEPKIGQAPAEKPTSIAGLLGNMFGSAKAEAEPAAQPAPEPAPAPVNKRDAKASHTPPRTAVAHNTAPKLRGVTHDDAQAAPQPKAVAASKTPEPQGNAAPSQTAKAAGDAPRTDGRELRTAYSSTSQNNGNGMLSGAQPLMPTGSFDQRWSAAFR